MCIVLISAVTGTRNSRVRAPEVETIPADIFKHSMKSIKHLRLAARNCRLPEIRNYWAGLKFE